MSSHPRHAEEHHAGLAPRWLRARLQADGVVTNAWLSGGSSYLAEVLSHAGYDSVTVDLQHGMFGVDTAVQLLQAVGAGPAVAMARAPGLDPTIIGKLLDGGAWGIVCPAIDTPEQCQELVAACRYPPTGRRSYGPARGLLVGGPTYPELANGLVLTWAMIESATALEHLEDILHVDGLDGVYVGPNDLAMSLGEPVTGELTDLVRRQLVEIASAARAAGRFSGAFAATEETAAWLAESGFDLVTPGNDAGLLRDAASRRIAAVQRGAGRHTAT